MIQTFDYHQKTNINSSVSIFNIVEIRYRIYYLQLINPVSPGNCEFQFTKPVLVSINNLYMAQYMIRKTFKIRKLRQKSAKNVILLTKIKLLEKSLKLRLARTDSHEIFGSHS